MVKKSKEKKFATIKFFKYARKTIPISKYVATCEIDNKCYSIRITDIPATLEFEDFALVRVQLLIDSQELLKGEIFITEGSHVVGVCNVI